MPRPRVLRAPLLRERVLVDRFFAAPDLRVADERLVLELDDFARVDVFFAPDERVERDAPALELFAREAVLRLAVDLRAVFLPLAVDLRGDEPRDALDPPELAACADPPSSLHLPDITRCAASATASAMIAPNLVALDTMLLAAFEAVSAASRPASRILRRAAGLALIAAAAAARPAASISLLIAALASLSTVLSLFFERDDDARELDPDERADERDLRDLEELFFADFAIAYLPPGERHINAVTVPK